jgi:hypothetical protein
VVPAASGGSPSTTSFHVASACVTASCCALHSGWLEPGTRNWEDHHFWPAVHAQQGRLSLGQRSDWLPCKQRCGAPLDKVAALTCWLAADQALLHGVPEHGVGLGVVAQAVEPGGTQLKRQLRGHAPRACAAAGPAARLQHDDIAAAGALQGQGRCEPCD